MKKKIFSAILAIILSVLIFTVFNGFPVICPSPQPEELSSITVTKYMENGEMLEFNMNYDGFMASVSGQEIDKHNSFSGIMHNASQMSFYPLPTDSFEPEYSVLLKYKNGKEYSFTANKTHLSINNLSFKQHPKGAYTLFANNLNTTYFGLEAEYSYKVNSQQEWW